ncbi:XRE family transcriptional regulator [Virgibacillus necropolis]|uniref:XRE family transcriptional regulator n=1 Tax=Virgibacillus necropolis TaxID=163877 RepID=A0A221MI75_9BACI|nr:helix-turn-helix transcriptional regulator [Virgibacillus necropolis]ASN07358.1 XRE family transcriptional regulator [Virgibacillus necropolis]
MIKCNLKAILDERKREGNEISIRKLADKAGLNFETVRRLYNDETKQYHRESVAAVCVALDVELSELLTLDKGEL